MGTESDHGRGRGQGEDRAGEDQGWDGNGSAVLTESEAGLGLRAGAKLG